MSFIESFKTRFVLWVWRHSPNCAEMSRLASRGLDQPPTLSDRSKMGLHFLICVWCKRYQKQVTLLHRTLPPHREQFELATPQVLSFESKERMIRRIHAAQQT